MDIRRKNKDKKEVGVSNRNRQITWFFTVERQEKVN